jgi:hypothetical protein
MSQFVEMLKQRLAEAQRRVAITQVNLQKAQQEHNTVLQEFNSWNNALAVEMRREQETQGQIDTAAQTPGANPEPPVTIQEQGPEINKAGLIREVLQRYPNGVRPVKVWMELRDQVPRPYVYSVLSRMKQKKQARELRGKYSLVQAGAKIIGNQTDENGGAVN